MKQPPQRSWPKAIVEIPNPRPDSRADPQATQKISREQLDEALKRTKSGTRRSVRSDVDHDELDGPRDDSPQITITRIDSVDLAVFDPSSLPAAHPSPLVSEPAVDAGAAAAADPPAAAEAFARPTPLIPRVTGISRLSRTRSITPRTAFIAGVAVAIFVVLAAFLGFFAGRAH